MSTARLRIPAAVFAGALGGLLWWPLVPLGVATTACSILAAPRVERRRRRGALDHALVGVVDLVIVAVSAGSTVSGALELVAERGPPAARAPFGAVLDRHRAGEALPVALRRLGDLAGPDFGSLALVLAQAEREGAPLGVLLRRLADEAAAARRRRNEADARRLPVQLLIPLVCCSLPAVIVGAVVPLVIVSLGRL